MNPRYTEQEIWTKVLSFGGEIIPSLTGKSAHTIVSVDISKKRYQIEYERTKSWPKPITLAELYALYCELHGVGELSNRYMEAHCRQVLGWPRWHAPGSAMMAILPKLDDSIDVVGGTLRIRSHPLADGPPQPAPPVPISDTGATTSTGVPEEKIPIRQPAEVPRGHNMHCKGCKASVETMLRKLYGQVHTNHNFDLGTRPEDFKNSEYYLALVDILSSLEKHRGFTDFIRSATLPNVDFFVPDPGFIVEFDEPQHFSLPRQIALDKYPPSFQLGYNRDRWSDLCARIKAHDPDPPFRDEQRAWYDALRDFAPAFLGLGATVRLYAGDRVWCDLDPDRRDHLQQFLRLIEGRTDPWMIEVRDAPEARVARVIVTCDWEGDGVWPTKSP